MVAGVAGLSAAAGTARADYTSANATLVSNVAATDNVFAASDGGDREADTFVQVRPGVILAYETPRMVHELIVEVEALDYIRNYDDESINFHGGYRARLDPTPRSTFTLLANGLTGRLSQLESYSAPADTGVALTPAGKVNVESADASELYNYTISPALRFTQSLEGRFADTNDNVTQDVTSYEGGATVGLDRTWRDDTLGLEVGAVVLHLQRLGPISAVGFDRLDRQVDPHATLNWRHDFNKRWSSSLTAGALAVQPFNVDPLLATTRSRAFFPVVSGTVAYTDDWGKALFTAGHVVTPNLFIAENTTTDSVVAQVQLPLWFAHTRRGQPEYIGAASLGFARTNLIDDDTSGDAGQFDIYHGDVGVAYAPRPGIAYSARYEYFRQSADTAASMLFGSYSRSTVFVTFSARWPASVNVDVPKGNGKSVRSDGSDQSPIGEELVVPDEAAAASDHRGQGGGGDQGGNGTGGLSGNGAGTSGAAGTGVSGGVSNGPP
jgi:hypothetical protein